MTTRERRQGRKHNVLGAPLLVLLSFYAVVLAAIVL